MTEPSQYFKGRTVQEQMNEVIGYVDARAEEVAAAKADDVLEPAEQAKDDAIAAKEAAEGARDTTLAALPAVNERIDNVESDLNVVTLRVTTAEGDIVTIQGRITAVETKNSQQDSAIAALQTADGQNVKLTGEHAIENYAVLLTGNQTKNGELTLGTWLQISGGHDRSLVRLNNSRFNNLMTSQNEGILSLFNTNGQYIGGLSIKQGSDGKHTLVVQLLNSDGSSLTTTTLVSSS